jgi:hypothetical protein
MLCYGDEVGVRSLEMLQDDLSIDMRSITLHFADDIDTDMKSMALHLAGVYDISITWGFARTDTR